MLTVYCCGIYPLGKFYNRGLNKPVTEIKVFFYLEAFKNILH